MEAFHTVLDECQLMDVGFSGLWFTWEQGNLPKTNIRVRLDRGVANVEWFSAFPHGHIQHLPYSHSDHFPLFILTEQESRKIHRVSFRFETWWLLESSFEKIVIDSWEKLTRPLPKKLKNLKQGILQWAIQIRKVRVGIKQKLSKKIREPVRERQE